MLSTGSSIFLVMTVFFFPVSLFILLPLRGNLADTALNVHFRAPEADHHATFCFLVWRPFTVDGRALHFVNQCLNSVFIIVCFGRRLCGIKLIETLLLISGEICFGDGAQLEMLRVISPMPAGERYGPVTTPSLRFAVFRRPARSILSGSGAQSAPCPLYPLFRTEQILTYDTARSFVGFTPDILKIRTG